MKGYIFNEIDTNTISLKSNNSNCSQITEEVDKKNPVEMHGHTNSYIGQQIFYTYNEQQLQRMISSNNDKKLNGYVTSNISASSTQTHLEQGSQSLYPGRRSFGNY